MFRGVRQCGFIPVLQSFGSSPLELWDMKVENGCVRRVTDEQVRALALEISGTNVSTCYLFCPKNPRGSLGIHMPYLVMIIKSLKKYFTFEITILDDKNVHRRFRLSNFQKMNRIHHFCTSMPLCLHPGWNEIYFDLCDITRKAYKTSYVETTRIQIHANCRVRVIYFCDRIYEDKDVPQKLKIFLPNNHVCRRKKSEDVPEKKETVARDIDFEAEYQLYEEEEEAERGEEEEEESEEGRELLDLEESIKSLEEEMAKVSSGEEPASFEDEQSGPMTPVVEEDEEEEKSAEDENIEGEVEGEGEEVGEDLKQERPEEDETKEADEHAEADDLEDEEEDNHEHDALEG